MKRFFDFSLALIAAIILLIPMMIIAIIVRCTSPGPAVYWSDRVGKRNRIFRMPKFRTMYVDTPAVATHLLQDSRSHITPVGAFLRKTSLDELPQVWSILTGEMSFVGPRPALFNQDDLVALRTEKGVDALRPGLTGWAQINGRDDLPIVTKVEFDVEYLQKRSFAFDLLILARTFIKVVHREGVAH
jgi:O-antigen biosynthesis protein WbqP